MQISAISHPWKYFLLQTLRCLKELTPLPHLEMGLALGVVDILQGPRILLPWRGLADVGRCRLHPLGGRRELAFGNHQLQIKHHMKALGTCAYRILWSLGSCQEGHMTQLLFEDNWPPRLPVPSSPSPATILDLSHNPAQRR